MFKHTFASVNLIKRELSFFTFTANLISTLFTVIFLIYSLISGRGYFVVTIILAALTLINFTVYATIRSVQSREMKEVKKVVKHCYRITKIFLGAIPLVIVILTLAFTTEEFSRIELVFLPLMLLMWMAQVIFEISSLYTESRLALFADAIKMDVEGVVNPLLKIRNAIKGESYRNDDIHVSDRNRAKLNEELENEPEPDVEYEQSPPQKDDFFTRLTKTKDAIKELIKK